jgi:translin
VDSIRDDLEAIAEGIRQDFSGKDSAREKGLSLCRETIRHSSDAIRSLHRQEYELAGRTLSSAGSRLDEVNHILGDHPDLLHSGFVHDAQKEFAEGSITLALVTGNPLPAPASLGVSPAAYLNGLGEAVGELRRYLLDSMRKGELAPCDRLLEAMDDIYGVLVTMDFPDAMTKGLRRTTDAVRGILEKTRGELTMALRQRDLEKRLASFEERASSGKM